MKSILRTALGAALAVGLIALLAPSAMAARY